MAKCKGCGQQIEWIKTTEGRSMPVNPDYIEIDPAGIHHDAIVTDEGKVVKGCRVNETDSLFQTEGKVRGRVPHWATCPQASRFKK